MPTRVMANPHQIWVMSGHFDVQSRTSASAWGRTATTINSPFGHAGRPGATFRAHDSAG